MVKMTITFEYDDEYDGKYTSDDIEKITQCLSELGASEIRIEESNR